MVEHVPIRPVASASAAICLTVAAYCYLRWRANLAIGAARLVRFVSGRGPRFLRCRALWSPRLWRINTAIFGGGLLAFAVAFWSVFLAAVLKSEAAIPAAAPAAAVGPRRDVAAAVWLLSFSAVFILYGLHHIVWRRKWAAWNEWLHDTELPFEVPYRGAEEPGASPLSARWVVGMVVVGVYCTLFGLVLMWLAVFRFLLV